MKENAKASRPVLDFYKKNSILTRLHVFIRYKTCPFFAIERFIPKTGIIVDYGCGHGIFSHILSLTSCRRTIYALDTCVKKIKEAKKALSYGKSPTFLDIKEANILIPQADCLVMIDVFSYFSHREKTVFLKHIFKNLKNGAVFIIKEIRRERSLGYALLYMQEKAAVSLLGITQAKYLNFYTVDESLRILKDAGFRAEYINLSRKSFYPHVLYVCHKQ